jgi:hypothetical protein
MIFGSERGHEFESPEQELPTEQELNFAIPRDSVNLSELPKSLVRQTYLEPKQVPKIIKLVQIEAGEKFAQQIASFRKHHDFKHARVRHSIRESGHKYLFAVKGPKDEKDKRIEIEVPISRDLYMRLLMEYDSVGYLEKPYTKNLLK